MKPKSIILRILALLLVLFIATGTFYACSSDDGKDDTGKTDDKNTQDSSVGDNGKDKDKEEDPPVSETELTSIKNLQDFVIIYPEGSVALEHASAAYLAEYILEKTGYTLEVSDDTAEAKQYEILIGDTNRDASAEAAGLTYGENDILIKTDGEKIVLYGKDLMVAGAMGEFASKYITGEVEIKLPKDGVITQFEQKSAKNIILMIGDGMGFGHIELAKSRGLETFKAEFLPNQGTIKTSDVYGGVTDSAAAATALSSGYKTINGYLGVDKDLVSHKNIREVAFEYGYKTAVITTDTLDGATPSGFLVHFGDRNGAEEILAQANAVKESEGDMIYIAATNDDAKKEGKVSEHLAAALKQISTDSKGFFIMHEEAHIDKFAHNNATLDVDRRVKRFDESIAYAIAFTMAHPDTILIITADHETGGITLDEESGKYKFTSKEHTGVDVPIFAFGQGTEIFSGQSTENTEVPKFLAKIFGVDVFGTY